MAANMLLKLDVMPRAAVGLLARAWPSAPPEPSLQPLGPEATRRRNEARRRVDAERAAVERRTHP